MIHTLKRERKIISIHSQSHHTEILCDRQLTHQKREMMTSYSHAKL